MSEKKPERQYRSEAFTVSGAARLVGKIVMARRGSKHFHIEEVMAEAQDFTGQSYGTGHASIEQATEDLTVWANSHPGTNIDA